MRPYRGLTKDGKWVYGWYQRTDPSTPDKVKHYIIDCCGVTSTALVLAETLSDLLGYHEVIPETVGQSTGLPDKNGKEIYEGDIVKEPGEYNEPIITEVQYAAGWFVPLVKIEYGYNAIDYPHNPKAFEIIGNIHQNPELLENPK